MSDDTELLKKIDAAAEAVNASLKIIETAKADHLPKCKVLGLALLELKQRYPKVTDFEAKLKECKYVKLSAAYDYMRLAGGRKTDGEILQAEREHREAAKLRKQKSRAKAVPKPKPEPAALPKAEPEVSVTEPHVTEIPIDDRRQAMADLATAELTTEEKSDDALVKWKKACEDYCNEMTEADLKNARVYFMEQRWRRKQKRAA
jgi:hypothetical protein